MKFVCLGFYDATKYAQMSPDELQRMTDACFAYDDELRRGGHFLGGEALQPAAVTVQGIDGEVGAIDGPFAETKEILGGILLLEARDLQHAVALMSKHPAVKFGNAFEIRPVNEEMNRIISERNAQVAQEA
jgi:hypothetical protein